MAKLYLLEPSKTGWQHITFLEGIVRSLAISDLSENRELLLVASESTLLNLSSEGKAAFSTRTINVIPPTSRKFFRKSILEVFQILKVTFSLKNGDRCFVTCVLPTTLFLLEIINAVLRKRIDLIVHGEIEGLIDDSLASSVGSFGFWMRRWARIRPKSSRVNLIVLEEMFADCLVAEVPGIVECSGIGIVRHPIIPLPGVPGPGARALQVCVIGLESGMKNYQDLDQLIEAFPDISFIRIGGGIVKDLRSGVERPSQGYHSEIAQCRLALFPYKKGYTASMSASAFDAFATKTPIVAYDRDYFCWLNDRFEFVQTVSGVSELLANFDGYIHHWSVQEFEWSEIDECYGLPVIATQLETVLN
ncbi:MAG: hypothetical protein P1U89_26155 [Verrucomicrobiales bacterium]|nr:hypothetical protein [Verrucomicrobiales bacterium]